tara:strand:+ start:282 stop:893 length:612 start_codon:yes stop_codon:yes gene_type:complete
MSESKQAEKKRKDITESDQVEKKRKTEKEIYDKAKKEFEEQRLMNTFYELLGKSICDEQQKNASSDEKQKNTLSSTKDEKFFFENEQLQREISMLPIGAIGVGIEATLQVEYFKYDTISGCKTGDANFKLNKMVLLSDQINACMERVENILPIKGLKYNFHLKYLSKDGKTYFTVNDTTKVEDLLYGSSDKKKLTLKMNVMIY